MRTLLLSLTALLLAGCDMVQKLARGSAPEHAYAQEVPMDTAGVVARRVAIELPTPGRTAIGPNELSLLPGGQSAAVIDWDTGDLIVLDFATGERRNLTNNTAPYAPGSAEWPSVSPDGKRVAYTWYAYGEAGRTIELRVLDLTGGSPLTLFDSGPLGRPLNNVEPFEGWIESHGWSRDGRRVAVALTTPEGTWQIAILPTDGGKAQILRTLDWRGPGRIEFSADGRYLIYDHQPDADSEDSEIFVIDLESQREHVLVGSAADDRLIGWIPGSDEILFSSDRTGTRGLWRQRVENGTTIGDPVLVKPDFWRADARKGVASDGRLYYSVQVATTEAMMAAVDTRAGLLGAPEPILGEDIASYARGGGAYPRAYWSHDGRMLAVVTRREGRRPPSIVVRSLRTDERREYSLPTRVLGLDPLEIHWSPDGTAIYMLAVLADDRSTPMRLDLGSGRTEVIDVPLQSGEIVNGVWPLPGGSVLVRRRTPPAPPPGPNPGSLAVRDLTTGTERRVFEVEGGQMGSTVSPDGSTVAVMRRAPGQDPHVLLVPTSGTGEPRRLEVPGLDKGPNYPSVTWESSGRAIFWMTPNPGPNWSADNSSYTLTRVPVDGSAPTTVTVAFREGVDARTGGGRGYPPLVSPDGDRITYFVGESASELWVLEGLTGTGAGPAPR